mgnify:CR=1 FL=1
MRATLDVLSAILDDIAAGLPACADVQRERDRAVAIRAFCVLPLLLAYATLRDLGAGQARHDEVEHDEVGAPDREFRR